MRRMATSITLLLAAMLLLSAPAVGAGLDHNFRAHHSGREEVPLNESRATGQAIFKLDRAGATLDYKLIVANIENVTQAHIHLAPAGANGGMLAWLYPDRPPAQLIPGWSNGVLATGAITADDLVGGLAGAEMRDLVAAMQSGCAYVNVHTSQFPDGEMRGQIADHPDVTAGRFVAYGVAQGRVWRETRPQVARRAGVGRS